MAKQLWIVALTFCLSINCARSAPSAPTSVLSRDQQMELRTLTGQLSDTSRAAQTKQDAATLLLARSYPQASQALRDFLLRKDNRPARIAVAQAIARYHGNKNKIFIEPLIAMLTGDDPSVRAVAAQSLGTFKNQGVAHKLTALVKRRDQDSAVRLAIITALGGMLDKKAVDALVALLDDPDAAIRDAAAAALTKLTSIRSFGKDRARWKRWWRQNKNKPHSAWLADLADSLSRAKSALEADNARLRERLVKAVQDIYAVTPSPNRNAVLLSFVKDPLADVRIVGLALMQRRITANENISKELELYVQTMLADEDPRVRRSSALLVAGLSDQEALDILLKRLDSEQVQSVRQGLLTALGQLRDPRALPAVLREIRSSYEDVSAAAAIALDRIASKQPLTDAQRDQAAKALVQRYRMNGQMAHGQALREALLTAMGVAADKAVAGVLSDALKDPDGTVRLAAVNSLAQLGDASLAQALVPMTADTDRGVRQAAISALGKLDGASNLQTVLQRTRIEVEADAAVRRQAWDVVMAILAKADAELLWTVSEKLEKRADAAPQRIKVAQMLVDVLKAGNDAKLPTAQRQLARELLNASRPAEAAAHLGEAYAALNKTSDTRVPAVRLEWISALLDASDPTAIKVIAETKEAAIFDEAVKRLGATLNNMLQKERYPQAAGIAREAISQLGERMDADGKNTMAKVLAVATEKLAAADHARVSQLVAQLLAADAAAASAASTELTAMGERAAKPLVEELRKTVSAAQPDEKLEKAILNVLTQIAPKLTDYDPKADQAERIKKIDAWLGELSKPSDAN